LRDHLSKFGPFFSFFPIISRASKRYLVQHALIDSKMNLSTVQEKQEVSIDSS